MDKSANGFNDITQLLHHCWQQHSHETQRVAQLLADNIELIKDTNGLNKYLNLLLHVYGGHLGQWAQANALLTQLKATLGFDDAAINRALLVIAYCSADQTDVLTCAEVNKAELCRVYSVAASELTSQGQTKKALQAFKQAMENVPKHIDEDISLARGLAVTCNNIACDLEEKSNRDSEQTQLMLLAAKKALCYWAIVGGWLERQRAEYRLAMSYLKAGELSLARQHAQYCETICQDNGADSYELFFAHELLVQIHHAYCVHYRSHVSREYQADCVISLLRKE